MYALDSNTIIHLFRGKGAVAERLAGCSPSQIAIPSVVVYEVERGVLRSQNSARRHQQLQSLLAVCQVLPFHQQAASQAARIQVHLESLGLPIGPFDTLIAATALAHGAILVTNNTSEFERVPGLQLEDWYTSGK